jgi:RimJ/RimL family protein N-acetyltransferase
MILETARLILRPWEARDAEPFAAMNADPRVMRHFPRCLDRAASDALMARMRARSARDGLTYAATERRVDGAFLGMIGLIRTDLPGTPVDGAVEIGWRLAHAAWGHGYATEGAVAWLDYCFAVLDLPEILSFTSRPNLRSQAVMRRLGMRRDPARDFDHPRIAEGSPLRRHLTWALSRDEWMARA